MERWPFGPWENRYGRSKNTFCAAQRLTNIEVIALLAVLLWNRLFWFNFFPCSGMTLKVQTVQGERVLLKLGIWTDDPKLNPYICTLCKRHVMLINSVAKIPSFSFLYLLHWPINHQPFTKDNGLNTWACSLYIIHEQPFVFPHGIKIHCTFLKCFDCRKHRNAPTFNLHSAPPSIGTFPILDRWGKDECL